MEMYLSFKSVSEIAENHGLNKGGRVQKFIDNEVLRRCDKYTPKQTGKLISSGTKGTVIGSGRIIYTAPYAKPNYYHNAGHGAGGTATGGLRGRLWFERMRKANGAAIVRGAAIIARSDYRV